MNEIIIFLIIGFEIMIQRWWDLVIQLGTCQWKGVVEI